jgi:hypothetical protein
MSSAPVVDPGEDVAVQVDHGVNLRSSPDGRPQDGRMATAACPARMLRMTDACVTEMPLRLEAITKDPFGDFDGAADSNDARLRAVQLFSPEQRRNAIVDQPAGTVRSPRM